MSSPAWLAVYSVIVIAFSLLGGWLPLRRKVTHARLQLYLSLSAGVMLGAAFFHVMPHAMEMAGEAFGWWMALSVVGLVCIERFIAPHSHELDEGAASHHRCEADCRHEHLPAAAPPVAGWMAVLGLTIHTFMNGVGLAGAVQLDVEAQCDAGTSSGAMIWALPGLSLFLAVVLHKPADALAVSAVLARKGVPLWKLAVVQCAFAATVPLGALAFLATHGAIEAGLKNQITGAALSFSAGTFLLIALSDLLPEVQFHRHDRIPLFLALVLGICLMGLLALLEHRSHDHSHDDHGHEHGRINLQDPAGPDILAASPQRGSTSFPATPPPTQGRRWVGQLALTRKFGRVLL